MKQGLAISQQLDATPLRDPDRMCTRQETETKVLITFLQETDIGMHKLVFTGCLWL
jgi:hypothetical protein